MWRCRKNGHEFTVVIIADECHGLELEKRCGKKESDYTLRFKTKTTFCLVRLP